MGLSAWNAYRARKAAEEKAIQQQKELSTSPVFDGVEVEVEQKIEEQPQPEIKEVVEPKPKKKKK